MNSRNSTRGRVRWPAIALAISIVLSEIPVGGRFIRVDLGALANLARKRVALATFGIGAVLTTVLAGGVNAVVTTILLLSPFAALFLGRQIGQTDSVWIQRYLAALILITTLQAVLADRLIDRFAPDLYGNPRPFSAFSTEPSFGYEFLFGLWLLTILLCSRKAAALWGMLLLAQAGILGVLTVWQNTAVLLLSAVLASRSRSRKRTVLGAYLLLPSLLIYSLPSLSIDAALLALHRLDSWRQISNAVALGHSSLIETHLFDYNFVVGDSLSEIGYPGLALWITSAFSWFPFLHTVGGRIFAWIGFVFLLRMMPRDLGAEATTRGVVYCSLFLGMYTAPKWLFIYMVVAGAASAKSALESQPTQGEASLKLRRSEDVRA